MKQLLKRNSGLELALFESFSFFPISAWALAPCPSQLSICCDERKSSSWRGSFCNQYSHVPVSLLSLASQLHIMSGQVSTLACMRSQTHSAVPLPEEMRDAESDVNSGLTRWSSFQPRGFQEPVSRGDGETKSALKHVRTYLYIHGHNLIQHYFGTRRQHLAAAQQGCSLHTCTGSARPGLHRVCSSRPVFGAPCLI